MTGGVRKLNRLLRVRALELSCSQRHALATGKELAEASAASEAAEGRHIQAATCEGAALRTRNAVPNDAHALLYGLACESRTREAASALHDRRNHEAEATKAAQQARRAVVRAETRHECIEARLHAEAASQRRRAERRREDEHRPAAPEIWQ